jgi:tetratricopeptide (TPR) repeat protein
VGGGHDVNSPRELVENARQARREGRYEDAERDLRQAISTSREAGLRADLIRALKALAHVVRDLGRTARALPLYEEAVRLSREEGDTLLLAHTVRHLGDLHREAARIADAERCYQEALSLYRAASKVRPLDLANALRPAAILEEMIGDVEAARQSWLEARRFYELAGAAEGVEECDRRLSLG